MKLILAFLVAWLVSPALAYDAALYPVTSEYAANQTLNSASHYTKAWTVSANGVDGVKIGRNFTMKAPGGRTVGNTLTGTLARDAAFKAGARILPVIGTGLLLYDLYDAVRVRPDGTGNGLLLDPGQPPETQQVEEWNISGYKSGSCVGAATLYKQAAYPTAGAVDCSVTIDNGRQRGFWTISSAGGACCVASGVVYADIVEDEICSQIEGPNGPYVPPMHYDQKCPTGQFGEPITPDEAAERARLKDIAAGSPPETIQALVNALNEGLDYGVVPITEAIGAPVAADVPNVAGGTTKETLPDGTTVETAVAWDFKPYGLTKGFGFASSGAWDKETTKTTCPGGGTQCTTETTRQENDPQGGTEAEGDDPERDFCKDEPNRAGCVELGEPPSEDPTWQNVDVLWSPESLGLPSGCPAGTPIHIGFGRTASYDMAKVCSFGPTVRLFLLAAASFAGIMLIVRTVQK